MTNERARALFKRYASPGSALFGGLMGLLYAALSAYGTVTDARILLALLFLTAGPMGLSYFWGAAHRSEVVPFMVVAMRRFFMLWTIIGFVWIMRIFAFEPADEVTALSVAIDLLVGTISGTVWMMALLFFIGRRLNVAAWEVYPAWIRRFARWLVVRLEE